MSYSTKKKNMEISSPLRSLLSCFFIKNESKIVKDSKSDPEETIISAAKHFSSAHKVD
ncbi:hypothetical protein RND71_002856 [Anisodus tanguticus]|uniref:Uncharacterized protein n=1 Tax=Anisodus tanguticus TaxID=243964 RepID=A0AAE1SUY2_9SOLA|nr:hypothetical protein RND71_002856 [Anisodus tanguticus]